MLLKHSCFLGGNAIYNLALRTAAEDNFLGLTTCGPIISTPPVELGIVSYFTRLSCASFSRTSLGFQPSPGGHNVVCLMIVCIWPMISLVDGKTTPVLFKLDPPTGHERLSSHIPGT